MCIIRGSGEQSTAKAKQCLGRWLGVPKFLERIEAWSDRQSMKLDEHSKKLDEQRAAMKQPGRDLAWCPFCAQNVRPVRRAKAGQLVLTGSLGYLLKRPTACPICKAEKLEVAH